jgi:hypothetical protein
MNRCEACKFGARYDKKPAIDPRTNLEVAYWLVSGLQVHPKSKPDEERKKLREQYG